MTKLSPKMHNTKLATKYACVKLYKWGIPGSA